MDIISKSIWTEKDFETMGWHDCKVHALGSGEEGHEVVMDLDYLCQWVPPQEDAFYSFWIAPATLVFQNVHDLSINLGEPLGLGIQDIKRTPLGPPFNKDFIGRDLEYQWLLDFLSGDISFKAVGYVQYLRSPPVFCKEKQWLSLQERGGISFVRAGYSLNDKTDCP